MNKLFSFIFLICFLFPGFVPAQGHSVPTSVSWLFNASDTSAVYSASTRLRLSTFYGTSSETLGGSEKPETSQAFSHYTRIGFSFTIDRHLVDNLFVGFLIPYLQSNIERLDGLYPSGLYTKHSVSEVRLRLGMQHSDIKKRWTLMLHTGIPVDKGREGFFQPEVFIGHDGAWNIGIDYSLVLLLNNRFRIHFSAEGIMRIAKTGMIIYGEPALAWTDNKFNAIQATVDIRDYITSSAGVIYVHKNWSYSMAFETYYETADNVYRYTPSGIFQMEAFVNHHIEHPGIIHSAIPGLFYRFDNLNLGLYGKIPLRGYTAFRENMFMFVLGFQI